MKSYSTILFAATVAAILSGCAVKEVPAGLSENETESPRDVTYATFNFAVTGSTKAPLTSDAAEKDSIKSVRLMIYSHTSANNGTCEVDTTVLTTGNQTATVPLTSGTKRIFVLANEHNKSWRFGNQKGLTLDKLVASKTASSAGKLFLHEIDFGRPALSSSPAPLSSLDYSDMTTPYMVFSNSQSDSSSLRIVRPNISSEESQSGSDSTKNHFSIDLQRTVAKVTITGYSGGTFSSKWTSSVVKYCGTLDDLYWGVRNQNRAVALFKNTDANSKPLVPFHDALAGLDLSEIATYKPFWWSNGDSSEINIPLKSLSSATPSDYYYVPENVLDEVGNSTYIVVKARFKPQLPGAQVTSVSFDNTAHIVNAVTYSSTLFPEAYYIDFNSNYDVENVPGSGRIRNLPDILKRDSIMLNRTYLDFFKFYQTEDLAKSVVYFLENDGSSDGYTSSYEPKRHKIYKYENYICYYRFDISGNADGGLLRNKQYRGTITSFGYIGAPCLEDLDRIQSTPSGSGDTHATATVQILPWDTVDVELKK
ncbi:MAG: hypothetical protein LBH04_10040 [Tannerellaceae bacterium]|nr:hypothetical protein [Tannerellaceae bacterium]